MSDPKVQRSISDGDEEWEETRWSKPELIYEIKGVILMAIN